MKNLFLLIIIVFTPLTILAQRPTVKRADKLFAQKSYVEAAKMYKALKSDAHILQNLGDSYYYNHQMDLARPPYTFLFTEYKDSIKPEVYFRFAQTLLAIKNYEKADEIMAKYLGYEIDTKKFIENLNNIVPYVYELKRMSPSNTTGDFGISFYGDKVVFSSPRNTENPIYKWNEKPYLDLYEATVDSSGQLNGIKPFSDEINTKTHESNATFTKDGKIMYFSRTNHERVKIGDEKIATVKIFKAELVDSIWTNVVETSFSSDTYSAQHPFLNTDNSKLYFSSDMPGGFGSFDIYSVDIIGDGFSEPKNLGETINTAHREQFPFVDEKGTLYFSSDGHQGMGGLDIFMSQLRNQGFIKPLNLGETINSEADDFGFVFQKELEKGYVASNREGSDNLYAFTRKDNERRFIVEGDVRDKHSKELLPGTTVTLFDENDVQVGEMVVGLNAEYVFNTKPNTKYKIEGHRALYIPTIEEFYTDDDGRLVFSIELEIESYDDAESIVVTKEDGYTYIELENIYFDLNKSKIKPQAARTLNVLIDLLNKYPRMEIQLGAHTDSRASEEYNLRLSNRRANAALEYLVENGINRPRLRAKGFGETKPLVDCGSNCSEEEHAINRRVEFLIVR